MHKNTSLKGVCLLVLSRTGGVLEFQRLVARWAFADGLTYRELYRESDVSQGRSALASKWLATTSPHFVGGEWSLWIDDDQVIEYEELIRFVENACETDADLVSAVYVGKHVAGGTLTLRWDDAVESVEWGKNGGYYPIVGCGFGCVMVRRSAFERIADSLPLVRYPQTDCVGRPYFIGMVCAQAQDPEGPAIHLGEDYAFCQRARHAGAKLVADTRPRVWHRGSYRYGVEDADSALPRFASLEIRQRTVIPDIKAGMSDAELRAIGEARAWEWRS